MRLTLHLIKDRDLHAILRSDAVAGSLHNFALPEDSETWPVVLVAHSSW